MKTDVHIRDTGSGRYEISTDEWKVTVVKRARDDVRQWNAKTRLYGAITALAAEADAKLDENIMRPAYGEGDGFTDEERAAHMKEYARLKRVALVMTKAALVAPLVALHAQLGGPGTDTPTVSFSKNAGCSMCPCSPGFILSTRWTLNGAPVDVWFEQIDISE